MQLFKDIPPVRAAANINNLHIFFHASVNNVFVITPYNGLDPETDAYAAAYPNARTFSFGVDFSF